MPSLLAGTPRTMRFRLPPIDSRCRSERQTQACIVITAFLIWWHRVVLRHPQVPVMNGPTEAGVKCYCETKWMMRRIYSSIDVPVPDSPHNQYRWFPSDGGHGR